MLHNNLVAWAYNTKKKMALRQNEFLIKTPSMSSVKKPHSFLWVKQLH